MRTGGVEPPQREAAGLQPVELAGAQRPHGIGTRGGRPGSNRRRGDHSPGCFRYTTATMNAGSGDDRTRTGGLSPDKRALCSAELRPRGGCAGGIRTHGLELMRLARTAAPLPRVVGNGRVGPLPRRADREAAAEPLPPSMSRPVRLRRRRDEPESGRQESNLRSPAPEAGGVPSPPRPDANEEPPAGVEPAPPG